jgi:hypothetical protein
MGLFSTDEGGVVQCAFTVAAVRTDQSDPDTAAQGILAVLGSDRLNDARWLDLPCGPAVSCITLREFTLSPEVTVTGEVTKLFTGQIQVHVPFATGPYTAVFTLHTASVEYWGEFCDITMAVLRTVAFAEPDQDLGQDLDQDQDGSWTRKRMCDRSRTGSVAAWPQVRLQMVQAGVVGVR